MDEQRRQRVAADGGGHGGAAERPGAGDTVRQHGEEEMGGELGFHGPLRLRVGAGVLGPVGVPDVVRSLYDPRAGTTRCQGHRPSLPPRSVGYRGWREIAHRRLCFLPVCIRRHHGYTSGRLTAWENELLRLDAVRAAVDHAVLHRGRLHHLGKWIPEAAHH